MKHSHDFVFLRKDMNIVSDKAKPDKQGKREHGKTDVDLKTRIAKAEHDFTNPAKGKRSRAELPADALALVGRIATELVAGTVVGTFIGWLLDQWLGTIPLFMVILFFLGTLAGMMNIWRMATGQGLKLGYLENKQSDDQKSETDDDKKG
jgi:ATP synthase protein I